MNRNSMTVTAARLHAVVFLQIAVVLLTAGGCQPKTKNRQPVVLPFAGQSVQILTPADLELRDLWEPILEEWQAATGATVAWSEYDATDPPWKSGAVTETPAAGRVVVLPLAELPQAEADGASPPLPAATVEAVDHKDLFIGLKEAVLSRDRKLMAAPVSAPVLLCYYRQDLLSAAGREPPRTWDDYQLLIDQLDQWAPKLVVMEPCGPEFRASLFLARALGYCKHSQNYSLWFDIQTGQPLFDGPGFERALESAQNAWKKIPADIWTMSPEQCRQALLDGRAAMTLTWEPSASYPRPHNTEAPTREIVDPLAIGVVALPGSDTVYHRDAKRWETLPDGTVNQPGLVGFTGLVIGVAASDENAAAWNLFESLVKHLPQAFADRPRSPCRETETASALFGTDGSISTETAGQISDATAETLRQRDAAGDLAIPQAHAIREIISAELAAAKEGTATAKDILAALQSKIATATESDRSALRAAYRRSLGLLPLK